MTESTLLYGAPGTGKTTRIKKEVGSLLEEGYALPDVLFSTFNVSMAAEGRNRLITEYPEAEEIITARWRTIHSHCYRLIREFIGPLSVVRNEHRKDFAAKFGCRFSSGKDKTGEVPIKMTNTDYFDLTSLYWTKYPYHPLSVFKDMDAPYDTTLSGFEDFMDQWQEYKTKHKLLDFADMPRIVLEEGLCPDQPVQFYDEHQDVFPIMDLVVRQWIVDADVVFVCGDPYQTIYGWCGADPNLLLNFPHDREIVLEKTWRLPADHWELGLRAIEKLPKYYPITTVKADPDKRSVLEDIQASTVVDRCKSAEKFNRSVFIICRSNNQVWKIAHQLKSAGVEFTSISDNAYFGWSQHARLFVNAAIRAKRPDAWFSPDELRALLKWATPSAQYLKYGGKSQLLKLDDLVSKQKIGGYLNVSWGNLIQGCVNNAPASLRAGMTERIMADKELNGNLIKIGTIHSSKGSEADFVFLNMSIPKGVLRHTEDDENNRVFFVGLTRAKQGLFMYSDGGGRLFRVY